MGVKSNYDGIIILELFPHCNFNCDFCFQNVNDRPDYYKENKTLFKKTKMYYMNLFLNKYETYNIKNIDFLFLWGGELFYDNSPEYNDLLMKIIYKLNPRKKIGFSSNLSNINSTLNSLLFDYQPFSVECCASYDSIGRFHNEEMLNNFLNNLEIVKKSPNIENGKIIIETTLLPEILDNRYNFEIFDKLYNDPQIEISLMPDLRGYPEYILENFNERFFNFLKKYPRLSDSKKYLKFFGYINDLEINSCNGNIKDKGCYCEKENSHYFTYIKNFDITNDTCSCGKKGDIYKIRKVYNCDKCKYDNICADICAGCITNSKLIELENNCPFKYIYDNIDELKKAYLKTLDKKELMKFLETNS